MLRVLGVDPGTAATGYGVLEGISGASERARVLQFGVVRTEADRSMAVRLTELHGALTRLIESCQPDVVAVEELFFARNVSTAMAVGQSRGVVLLVAGQAGLPVHEYQPRQVKLALTGYGNADKRQVQQMLVRLLGLSAIPEPDDAADALAIALCHLQSARWRALGERS